MFYKTSILALLVSLSMSATSFAATCYKATNPENISVTIDKVISPTEVTEVVEQGRSARLKVKAPSKSRKHGTADLTIRTRNYKYITTAMHFPGDEVSTEGVRYSVDCDGGNMMMKAYDANGNLVANSDGIAGEATPLDESEGCSDAMATFKDLHFKRVRCSK